MTLNLGLKLTDEICLLFSLEHNHLYKNSFERYAFTSIYKKISSKNLGDETKEKLKAHIEHHSLLDKKKVLLIGTSNGKFGNVMGVNHFEYTLNYVGSSVFTKKIYVPKLDENIENEEYIGYLKDVLLEFHLT
jgi:hypothetical protein